MSVIKAHKQQIPESLDTLEVSLSNSVLAAWTQMETDTTIILHGLNPSGQLITLKVNRDEDNTVLTFEGRTKDSFDLESGQLKCGFTCVSSTATLMPTESKLKSKPESNETVKEDSQHKGFNALHLLESVGSALQGLEDGVVVVSEGGEKGEQWIMTQDSEGQTVHVQNLDSQAVKALIEGAEASGDVSVVETDGVIDGEKVFAAFESMKSGPGDSPVFTENTQLSNPGPSVSQQPRVVNKRLREDSDDDDADEFIEEDMDGYDDDGIVIHQEGEIVFRCYICNEGVSNLEKLQVHFQEAHGIRANLDSPQRREKPPTPSVKKKQMCNEEVIYEVPFNKALEVSPSLLESPQSRTKRYDMVAPDTPLEAMFRTYKKQAEHPGPVMKKSDTKDNVDTEVHILVSVQPQEESDGSGDEVTGEQPQEMETENDLQTRVKLQVKEERINICVRPMAKEVKKDTEEDYAWCLVCENRFTTVESVLEHVQEVHGNMKNKEQTIDEIISANEMTLCFICGSQIRQFMLTKHLKEAHDKEILLEAFSGDVEKEDKSPTRQSSRLAGRQMKKDKISALENGQTIVSCPSCNKEMRAYSLKTHLKEACPAHCKQEEHACSECSYVGKTSRLLKIHVKNQHRKVDLVCKICSKHFDSTSKMNIHLREVHQHSSTGKPVRLFQCLVCNTSFVRKQRLVRHLKIHTGEKSIPCTECGKLFRDKADLRIHMRRVHLDDYPYRCERCDLGLVSKKALEQHVCKKSLIVRRNKQFQNRKENQS